MKLGLSFLTAISITANAAFGNIFISTAESEVENPLDIAVSEGFVALGLLSNGKLFVSTPEGIQVFTDAEGVPTPEQADFINAANIDEVPAARQPEVRAALLQFLEQLEALVGIEGSNVSSQDLTEIAAFLASFGLVDPDPIAAVIEDEIPAPTEDPDRPETPETAPAPAPAPPPTTTPPVDNNDEYFAPGS